jgi:hypothetical protein
MSDPSPGDEFKPGEKCGRSGIYRAVHDCNHSQSHEVTSVYGKPFPPCNHCGHRVRFVLVRGALHIDSHEHFAKAN